MSREKPTGTSWARKTLIRSLSRSLGMWLIVHSEQLPHGLWKLGRIQELHKGRDGHYKAGVVRTTNLDGQPELLRRPIQLLYPLESKNPSDSHELKSSAEKVSDSDIVSPSEEPHALTRTVRIEPKMLIPLLNLRDGWGMSQVNELMSGRKHIGSNLMMNNWTVELLLLQYM